MSRSRKRLLLLALLSPILVLATVVPLMFLVPMFFFPAARLGGLLLPVGFTAYGWVAGRFGGRGSGVAVGLGLGATWGLCAALLFLGGQLEEAGEASLVLSVSVLLAGISAEIAAWRKRQRLPQNPAQGDQAAAGAGPT